MYTSLAAVLSLSLAASANAALTDYVNLFIGTQGSAPGTSYNGGNVVSMLVCLHRGTIFNGHDGSFQEQPDLSELSRLA